MEELLKKSEEILTNNIGCYLDPKTKEILTLSILGVILVKGKEAIDKFPEVLKTLTVISDNRSVVEIAHQDLKNFQEDTTLSGADACVTRTIEYKNNKYEEQKTLIVSLSAKLTNPIFSLVVNCMHEFFHLLRFGGIEETSSGLIISDGISYATADKQLNLKRRKHYHMEEGIVEAATDEGIEQLKIFLQDYNPKDSSVIKACQEELATGTYKRIGHKMAKKLIKMLYTDPEFKNRAYQADFEHSRPSELAKYYDSVVGFGAFNAFSKKFDDLIQQHEFLAGTEEEISVIPKIEDVCADIRTFLRKNKKVKVISISNDYKL